MEPMNLLDQVKELCFSVKRDLLKIAVGLALIEKDEAWRGGYDSFPAFYQELGMEKSQVSKALSAGHILLAAGFNVETTKLLKGASVSTLYQAKLAYPDKEPAYLVAAADNNTLQEIKQGRRERLNCIDHQWIQICGNCHIRSQEVS